MYKIAIMIGACGVVSGAICLFAAAIKEYYSGTIPSVRPTEGGPPIHRRKDGNERVDSGELCRSELAGRHIKEVQKFRQRGHIEH